MSKHCDLIDVERLKSLVEEQDKNQALVILGTAIKDPMSGKFEPFPAEVIANSRYFDLEHAFSDASSGLPHTFPTPEVFESEARALGINQDSHIVVYDFKGLYSAPRVWWMFKVMGHNKVSVLNGGLPAWLAKDGPLSDHFQKVNESGNFSCCCNPDLIRSKQDILDNLSNPKFTIVDARSAERFAGTAPEPRKGLASGHIPGSLSLPFTELQENGKALNTEKLGMLFNRLAGEQQKPLVFTCGSGVTASILALLANEAGLTDWAVYDGSWTEWGSDITCPKGS